MTRTGEHSQHWHDSLQDWLDGELNDADRAVFEAHLAGCAQCQGNLNDFQQLDASLIEAMPPLRLDPDFDRSLLARLEAIDESQRLAARRRLEQEWQQQMQALSRNWRRTLAFVIPGILAGIVLAVALVSWLDSSGLTNDLAARGAMELGAAEFGSRSIDYLRLGITTFVGAALGMVVAPWLARLAE